MYSTNVKHQRAKRYQQLGKEIEKLQGKCNYPWSIFNYSDTDEKICELYKEYYSLVKYVDHYCKQCYHETTRKRYSNKLYRAKCKEIMRKYFYSGEEDLILPVWNKYRKSF